MSAIIKPGKLPENLKALRELSGMSQREAAKRLKLKSASTISHYETGRRPVTVGALAKLAEIYGVKIEIRLVRVRR